MQKPREVYCPCCKRRVASWDGRSKINVVVNCMKCKKRVVFHVDTKETTIIPIPKRRQSSGKRFS